MGFKATPQIMGLIRGEKKKGQKHRANGKAISAEAGNERISSSVTLDRTRSSLNQYDGFESGFALWDKMEKNANEYRTTFTDKNGVVRSRPLKSDAVVGFAVIVNPPEEECSDWDDATYQKFYDDSWKCLCEIEPRIFADRNVLMSAEHYDEGIDEKDRHLHKIGESKDEDGKYCGNLIDAKLLSTINKTYPAMMRSYGWDMEDLDTTDWEQYKTDKEYRAKRNAKSKKSGKSVNAYVSDKLNEQLKKSQEIVEQATIILESTERIKKENDKMAKELEQQKNELKQKEYTLEEQRCEMEQEYTARLQELKPTNVTLFMLGVIAKVAKSADIRLSADRVKNFIRANSESLSSLYEKQLDYIHAHRQRLKTDCYMESEIEKTDFEK